MTKPPLIWTNIILFTATFIGAVVFVPLYGIMYGYDFSQWAAFIILVFASGLSITMGYHRLWAHRSYKAHWSVRVIFALGGALALQNSALHWSSDHRVHHRHVDDNEKDPYSAKKGFWYSHIGWMLREYQPLRYSDYSNVRDLQKDKIVMWQHRYYLPLLLVMNIALPILLGWLTGAIVPMFLMAGVLRLVVSHHTTFFINSLAHLWGHQPYTNKNTARDNPIVAILTFGEGYHNFHHLFENDYRNGIQWWHYDPTKWLIKTMTWLKLADNLKVTPQERIESAKLQMQLKKTQFRVAQLDNCDEILQKIHHEYELLKTHIVDYYQAHKELLNSKRKQLANQQLSQKVKNLRQDLLKRRKNWELLMANYI